MGNGMELKGMVASIVTVLAMSTSKALGIHLDTNTIWPNDVQEACKTADDAINHLLDTREAELRIAFDGASAQIGELHLQQIENWEGEVKEVEGQRDRLAFKLADLQPQLEELEKLRADQETTAGKIKNLQDRLADANTNASQYYKALGDERTANDSLTDALNQATIENAELRGYQRRVNQFDPISDHELAERDDRPVGILPGRNREYADREFAAMMAPSTQRPAWYRQRRN